MDDNVELVLLLQSMDRRLTSIENDLGEVRQRVAKHSAYFKVLGVSLATLIPLIVTILVKLLWG